jgi:hypothetical protein
MPYIAPEIVLQAKRMDLLTYLKNYEPQELVHFSGDTYCTRTHDSLKISNGKWCWNSRGIGGRSALDYLIKVNGFSFTEAVEKIMGQAAVMPPAFVSPKVKKPRNLVLPKVYRYADGVVNYLHRRGIDYDIIDFCIHTGRLYESYPHHNAVFVGFDTNDKPKYANLRGIAGTDFKGEADGSDKRYSFSIPNKNSDLLHLFESAIDLLSYATMLKLHGADWRSDNLLSLAGVYQPKKNIEESKIPAALEQFLTDYPRIKKIALHLDNDFAGRSASKTLMTISPKDYIVSNEPPPCGKDYNDYLCGCLNISLTKIKERCDER